MKSFFIRFIRNHFILPSTRLQQAHPQFLSFFLLFLRECSFSYFSLYESISFYFRNNETGKTSQNMLEFFTHKNYDFFFLILFLILIIFYCLLSYCPYEPYLFLFFDPIASILNALCIMLDTFFSCSFSFSFCPCYCFCFIFLSTTCSAFVSVTKIFIFHLFTSPLIQIFSFNSSALHFFSPSSAFFIFFIYFFMIIFFPSRMTLCGTAEYMAPELMFDEDCYSFEIDVFSFGMVLLEILKRGRVGHGGFAERSPKSM